MATSACECIKGRSCPTIVPYNDSIQSQSTTHKSAQNDRQSGMRSSSWVRDVTVTAAFSSIGLLAGNVPGTAAGQYAANNQACWLKLLDLDMKSDVEPVGCPYTIQCVPPGSLKNVPSLDRKIGDAGVCYAIQPDEKCDKTWFTAEIYIPEKRNPHLSKEKGLFCLDKTEGKKEGKKEGFPNFHDRDPQKPWRPQSAFANAKHDCHLFWNQNEFGVIYYDCAWWPNPKR
ncbi:hypothetical protein BCR37DRAFT_389437 [Protomyces lactucae-debilis]|uniref:Uncharacterized protein n=1 Tax=Protomyces lactucae-debilis TaxID=2754530 RepID=A0A1Y2F043_PROLT|nr:uncharacterized protein BCR37DRAFT_389437 [Protomyces lactucae-debilis]ORY76345.1 hypothetical protein BCR37DRAFT_389437 [Protomyces lactucae-debilis]